MHAISLLSPLLLLVGAHASPLANSPRDSPAATEIVISDIGAINTAVEQTTDAINAYQGGIVEATPLAAGILDIHLVNRKAYADAAAALVLPVTISSAESGQIVEYTNKTVGVSIPDSVAALEAKKPQLDAAGVSSTIPAGLKLLLNDHLTYSDELLKKVSPDWLARAQEVVNDIADAIQGGINYFS